MNLEMLQIPVFAAVLFALASLIVMPVTSMALSGSLEADIVKTSDSSEGTACDLPPTLEISSTADSRQDSGLPLLDQRAVEKFRTATFAMG
jgi:hypothetical protein